MDVATNLSSIKYRISDYEKKYQRAAGSVQLLAASKGQSAEKILAAFNADQKSFGENYLQEALVKIEMLPREIEWHFIGLIQSNKTRKIAENFSWAQSVNDTTIAKRLNEQRPINLPPLNICIEVNVSKEATKSGIQINEVLPLAQYCLTLPHLKLRGLMAIPEPEKDFSSQRKSFQQLQALYQSLQQQNIPLDTLSMGMSDDFEAAIAEGSTMIRIGRAIFGERLK